MALTHSTVVVVADDPSYPVGTDEWNADHLFIGGAAGRVLFQGAADAILSSAGLSWDTGTNTLTVTNLALTGTGTGFVTSITGTANQVIASAATGPVTLSLPQNIHTGATPTFLGITLTAAAGSNPLVFNPGGGFQHAINYTTLTATRFFTLPNADSNSVIPDTGAANNFLTAISAGGLISKAQPSFSNISSTLLTTQMVALTGDVTNTVGTVATTIANNAITTVKLLDANVTYAKIQNVSATSRILGRITAGAGTIEELTGTQTTTLLDVFTSGLKGLAPASGGGTTNFLRADGTWTAPGGGGSPGGASGDVQFNNGAGGFGGEAAFTYDTAINHLTVPGVSITEDLVLSGVISPTALSTDQDDWNPTGLATASIIRLDMTASVNISGLVAGVNGRIITIVNASTDFMAILTHEDSSSAAANRFNFGRRGFYALLVGESASFWYDGTFARWRYSGGHHTATLVDQFDQFTDFTSEPDVVGDGPYEWLSKDISGAAASFQTSNYGVDTTSEAFGILEADTGTSSTGKAYIVTALTVTPGATIVPTNSGLFFVCRIAVPTLSTSAQRFQIKVGLSDANLGTDAVNGIYWEYDDAATTVWQSVCAGASTRTKTAITGLAVSTSYIILGIFINQDWTRADFFHSLDGEAYIVSADGTQSGVNMPTSTELVDICVGINKTVGATPRSMNFDYLGIRWLDWRR